MNPDQDVVKTEGPVAGCPVGVRHILRDDVKKIWKECQEESFWHRGLPFSVGSMAITGGLIYNGIWQSSKRFGPFPKLAVAGILGFAVGKISYIRTCRQKFQRQGIEFGPRYGPGFGGPWFGPGQSSGPGYRHCHHICEECKKQIQAPPAENVPN